MQKLTYQISIKAPAEKVTAIMLGADTYKLWTVEFEPTSDFEGGWNKGDTIYFTAIGSDGKKCGMVSRIAEHVPNKFVSIEHYGILDNGIEITEGEKVEKWAGGHENYTFEEQNDITSVTVDIDVTDEHLSYFNQTYPKALEKLKDLCEQ